MIKGIIRQYIAECTRSEGIFGVKRYNSPIYRGLLHSLGTRSEDNFLKVFNTTIDVDFRTDVGVIFYLDRAF